MNVHVPMPETERLAALDRYDLLDTPTELSFDRITRIATNALDVPIAGVSLIDGHRQWLKSRQGDLPQETCKSVAFCNVAIRLQEPLIVEDASVDPRFKDNPLVLGPPYIRFYAGAALCTPDGHNIGALCAIDTKPRRFGAKQVALLKDLADLVIGGFEARRLARTDSLTGVLTRRGFRDEAERALALSSRHPQPLSCIVFDLDRFKAVNDVHGHAIGDRVLVEAAKAGQERLRAPDIFGRIGGEEFAIILPHTDEASALKVAEQIRTALEQRVIVLPTETLKITASFGIAAHDHAGMQLDDLLRRADVALYAAKDAGRNKCVTWKPTPGGANQGNMRRVLKAGQVVFNAGRSVIDCTVRALGQASARIDVADTSGIPQKFKLAIADDGFSRACSITSRRNNTLELAFH